MTVPITLTNGTTASATDVMSNFTYITTLLENLPEGTLYNGKIVPSVASYNLTVALKTKAGTDPSATDPVYVMIGGTMRSITSALSLVRNAGQNYSGAGSAELATKEIDWFTYLVWNTIDSSVDIGFSRIPYGNVATDFDFSGYPQEKNCHMDTSVNTTDVFVNIGRFAATLSAVGTGYLWTVPTFTTSNLIQRPIYETRWLDYAPVLTSAAGSISSYTNNIAKYNISYNTLRLILNTTMDNNGSGSGQLRISYPFTPSSAGPVIGKEYVNVGDCIVGEIFSIPSVMVITKYNNAYPVGTGSRFTLSGFWNI